MGQITGVRTRCHFRLLLRSFAGSLLAFGLVFAISARFYRDDDPASAECRRLDADFRTPVAGEEGKVSGGALAVYGVIGNLSLVLGVVLMACTLLPSTAQAPASINFVGGSMLFAIGFGLRRLGASRANR